MYLIEIICEFAFDDEMILKNDQALCSIFEKYLQDADIQVRAATFKSITIFLSNISEYQNLKKFEGIAPVLVTKCIEAIKEDQTQGEIALQSFVELIETHPKYVRNVFNEIVKLFTEIMDSKQLSDGIRITALAGITYLATKNSSLLRKSEDFKTKTVVSFMKMIAETDQLSLEEWNNDLLEENLSKNDPSTAAQETLGKISQDMTVKFLLPIFIPMIV